MNAAGRAPGHVAGRKAEVAFDDKAIVGPEELLRPKMLPVRRVQGNTSTKEAVVQNNKDKKEGTELCLGCKILKIFLQMTDFS